jgi:uncharacterized protein (TIGR00375 family)
MSGFDSVQEAFLDKSKHIHALETGLSSDPAMNWRLSSLDKFTLISNSDSHSFWPWRIGRECNIFEMKELAYDRLIHILRTKEGFAETIEFFPEEGKYHYDGHRNCNIVLKPADAIKLKNICPVCKKSLTIGVLHRVEELADRPEGFVPKAAVPFRNLIPLAEVIAGALKSSVASNKVTAEYFKLINECGNEMHIMLDANEEEIRTHTEPKIAELIMMNREQKIPFKPGYDGVYGEPLFNGQDPEKSQKLAQNIIQARSQKSLDEF